MNKKISTFLKHFEDSALFEKKILIKNYYYKYLIISSTVKTSNHFSLDDFNSFKKTIILPKSYYKKANLLAYSVNLKSYWLKSIASFNNSFEIVIHYNNFLKLKVLDKIKKGLSNYKKSDALLLLSSLKGGYVVYSISGIKGFLPRNQLVYSFINKFQIFSENFGETKFIWVFFQSSKITFVYKNHKESICSLIFLIDSSL